MLKFFHILVFSAKNRLIYLGAFLFRNIFFVIILYIFFNLWRVIYGSEKTPERLNIAQLLWYLAFTESIELGKMRSFDDIQTEVKDGSIAYTLNRPYNYLAFTFCNSLGSTIIQMLPLLATGSVFSLLLAGPLHSFHVPATALVLLGGAALTVLWMILIGLLAFWLEEVTPVYWLVQKLVFIAGGMFIPIDFFPQWLKGISMASPFAFSAYWPAIVAVDFTQERFAVAVAGQTGYIVLFASICALLFTRAVRNLQIQGG